jgi:uncharacterized membrane protein
MKSKISIKENLGYSWEIFKKNPWFFIGIFILTGLVGFILPRISEALLTQIRNFLEPRVDVAVFLPVWGGLSILFQLITMVVTSWLAMGTTVISLRAIRGQDYTFSMLFQQKQRVAGYMWTTILISVVAVGAFLLFIIPGILWFLVNSFSLLLFVDKQLPTTKAIQESIRMTKGYRLQLFLWGLLIIGLYLLGMLPFGLGLFIVSPLVSLASARIYDQLLPAKE